VQDASASAPPAEAPAAPSASAPPAATYVVLRPPTTLGQGRYAAPAWLVGLCAGALVLAVVAFFVLRARRARRKNIYDTVAPLSGPQSSRR
jgi:hypothetical protein